MPRFLPDTSCMVAAVCTCHERHAEAAGEIQRRLGRGEEMVITAPGLVETYAVLTRLPPPHRLSPADALAMLDGNFMGARPTIALSAGSYRALLRRAPADGVSGGRTYDLVIAACALGGKAGAVLTFDADHFRTDPASGLQIVVPG